MAVRLFGISGRPVGVLTSAGRTIRCFRTELQFQIWTGSRFDTDLVGLWDCGADFVSISEDFAERNRIDWQAAAEQLGASGTAGSLGGVFVPLFIRLRPIPDLAFPIDCQVLLGSDFSLPLL